MIQSHLILKKNCQVIILTNQMERTKIMGSTQISVASLKRVLSRSKRILLEKIFRIIGTENPWDRSQ